MEDRVISQLLADAALRPDLYRWHGALDSRWLDAWFGARLVVIPPDLVEFYAITGGGEVFESEDILSPCPGPEGIDDWTAHFRSDGMRSGLLVFHRGAWVSAIDTTSGSLVVLQELRNAGRATTLDEWYRNWIRREFADRYGLPPVA
jgi:hypothetical protein